MKRTRLSILVATFMLGLWLLIFWLTVGRSSFGQSDSELQRQINNNTMWLNDIKYHLCGHRNSDSVERQISNLERRLTELEKR